MNKLVSLLFALMLTLQVGAQTENMTPEWLWSLGRVSLYDVSPDGQYVVYGVTYYDVDKNKGSRDLYLVNVKGGPGSVKQLTKTPESEGSAQFRPDGERIAYLKDGYVWEMKPDGTMQAQVSPMTVNGFKYAPDGIHVLYINEVKYKQTTEEIYPDLPLATGKIIDDLMYRHWDHWEDESYSNIFFTKYTNGKIGGSGPNIIGKPFDAPTSPFGGMEQITWSPDGTKIVYVCKKLQGRAYAESTNTDLYEYDLRSGKTRNLTANNKGYDLDPAFSPDGRYLAWNSMEKDGYEADRYRVMILDYDTGKVRELTRNMDHNAHAPQWSKDGGRIFFTSERKGTQHIYVANAQSGKVKQLTSGVFNYYDFIVTKEGLVARRASMSAPHEIFFVPMNGGEAKALTAVNADKMSKVKMGKVESRTVKTTDGKDMLVWMIYPPGFNPAKKYPALLYCQGGPQSQVSQFWSYRWNFQMMAANDYVIVAPNRRGLPGFGTEWNEQISGDWGGQAMQDYLAAIDDAKKEPYIDEERLGAVGASYGGYSVYWLAGNHNKRFKSFISHCGVFNLESWYGTTEELFFANHDMGGAYWQSNPPETYAQDSPHKYVQNWDTPILVIHNEKDFRVPLSEGMQAFNAAKMRGVQSRFLYFSDENHWVLKPQNGIMWQRVFFDWLDRTLKK